jgi:hypothetical protein
MALKVLIIPVTVPSKPSNTEMLAIVPRIVR